MVVTIIQCLLLILDIYAFLELVNKWVALNLIIKSGQSPRIDSNVWTVGILTALIIFLNTIKS